MDDSQTFRDEDYPPGFRSIHQERSDSPEISCASMKTDQSMGQPIRFKGEDTSPDQRSIQQQKNVDWPEISCVSMKSNKSMDHPIKFEGEDRSPDQRSTLLSGQYSAYQIRTSVSDRSINDLQSHENNSCSYSSHRARVQNTLKSHLRKKFECLYEGTSEQRNPTLLNEIYTELYITESESGEISNEHEVRQIETQSRRTATEDTPIKCNDIFKALPPQDKPIRSVLTKGVAGIGKTVSVQKFILDWTEGKENQDVHLIFPFPFREINLMKNQTLSLLDLLNLFFPETKEMEISSDEYKVLFIFDGLDECRVSLDFHSSVRLCDVSESASVDVILTNLMKGNLLPSALIWITSRPAAADLIPSECVDRVTEVRGFTDKHKEEYFKKRISDECLNNTIISHLKSSRSLYSMCHIPVFCWISATVLERMFSEAESEGEIPKTLTQMYTHFLIIQTNIKHQKDYEKKVNSDEDMIFKLAKLAFEQLVKGNLIFYDEDLRECGIDVAEASVYSGLCTQIFREEFGLYQGKVYSFLHLSIQEHLAALYAHVSFTNNNTNVFESELIEPEPGCFSKILELVKPKSSDQILLSELHQRAVDEALQSKNGHLDLFLRFLLGLSLESIQTLLQMTRCSYKKTETVEYIKQKIKKNLSPEKFINLFHCLNELDDDSLVEEIQQYVKSGSVGHSKFSSSQWSALVFVLLASEHHLGELDLNKFIGRENKVYEVLMKLQPVIKESKKIQLSHCSIKNESCVDLTSALISNPSQLRELNLYKINFEETSLDLLSGGLENSHCELTTLRLSNCSVKEEDCVALSSALRSNPSHLRDLDLSENKLGDSGVKLISTVLENPLCFLGSLRLERCKITAEGCAALSSSLRSNPSHLTYLDLSNNNVGDSGVKLISTVLENPLCRLEQLKLSQCYITDEGCSSLSSSLTSNPSHLRHLDLSNNNNLRDSGVKLICDVLGNPHCKLEKLVLRCCNITGKGCLALASALRSNSSNLKHLILSGNKFGDSGVKLISTVLENPLCKLETLSLMFCGITDEGRAALDSSERSNPSHRTDLKL
ncbi:LOW QUALITY PROTEIN: NACHT, LRR and PYD domains-containing protein 12-like [Triplophysa dalaica]|uniref:LOW QUALITY PROTEIN: NACHT, LRR and PYD domains-containing protein 12-like n=1 Tax=Triplophysa dalaica TaxID=1582913 RepID=UPI0024DFD2F1|nr:LOW QUALITY PROTEIN: NACHT, LRR and PYD domains-containing protein 12-like [Triplophysa dalaica]